MLRDSAAFSRPLMPLCRLRLLICCVGRARSDQPGAVSGWSAGQSPTRCLLLAQLQQDIQSLMVAELVCLVEGKKRSVHSVSMWWFELQKSQLTACISLDLHAAASWPRSRHLVHRRYAGHCNFECFWPSLQEVQCFSGQVGCICPSCRHSTQMTGRLISIWSRATP